MKLSICADYATPWLFVREGYLRLWRIEWHIVFLDQLVAGAFVTTFHGNRWPRWV